MVGFEASEEETNEYSLQLKEQLWECFRLKIKEETSDQNMQNRLRSR